MDPIRNNSLRLIESIDRQNRHSFEVERAFDAGLRAARMENPFAVDTFTRRVPAFHHLGTAAAASRHPQTFGPVSPRTANILRASQPWTHENTPLRSGGGAAHNWRPSNRGRWTYSSDGKEVAEDPRTTVNATLFNVGVAGNMAWREASGTADLAGGFKTKGRASVGRVEGEAGLRGDYNFHNAEAELKAYAGTRVEVIGLEGSIARPIGSKDNGITPSLYGRAAVLGEAKAEAGLAFNPRAGTAKLGLGAEAFAGAKAEASLRNESRFLGERLGSSSVGVEGYAGAGAKAKADLGFDEGKFRVTGEVGVALGLGAGVKLEVEVDVIGVGKAGYKAANEFHGVIERTGESLGEAAFWGYYYSKRGLHNAARTVGDWID